MLEEGDNPEKEWERHGKESTGYHAADSGDRC